MPRRARHPVRHRFAQGFRRVAAWARSTRTQNRRRKQDGYKGGRQDSVFNADGNEVLAVNVKTDGSNNLDRLDALTGNIIASVPNPNNYFFTQTKYIYSNAAVAAVRHPNGKMALVKIDLTNGNTENITPFSFN